MNEQRLKRALEERAQMVHPSADLFARVKWEANRRKKEKVEEFENGYRFASGGIFKNLVQDENGATVGEETKGLIIDYQNDAGNYIMLTINQSAFFAEGGVEINLGYRSDAYKFVPPDYEATADDQALEAKGELNLSYGSDEVTFSNAENYTWQDGELTYSLTALDLNLGEAEMARMAQQIMG